MKKILFIFLAGFIAAAGITSCKKVVNAIFPGLDITVPSAELGVPVMPFVLPMELGFPSYTQSFNLDSTIKANTGGAFGAGSVSSVKIKSITMTISNADDNNNWSNFESARFMLSSDTKQDPVELFSYTFPTTNTTTVTITPTNSPELLPYLKGKELVYQVFGKGRKTTSKPLTIVVSTVMRVK